MMDLIYLFQPDLTKNNGSNLLISTCCSFVCNYNSLIRSRSHQGQSQTFVGGLHSTEMRSC